MSRGALYHHFANKEALLEAVYEAAQAGVAHEIVGRGTRRAANPIYAVAAHRRLNQSTVDALVEPHLRLERFEQLPEQFLRSGFKLRV